MGSSSFVLAVLMVGLLCPPLHAAPDTRKHHDFGHVPMGLKKKIDIEYCNDGGDDVIEVQQPPTGFTFTTPPEVLTFSQDNRCHPLSLIFTPPQNNSDFSHYGYSKHDGKWETDPSVRLTGINAQKQEVVLTTLSGIGVSQAKWEELYPVDPETYILQSHIDFSDGSFFCESQTALSIKNLVFDTRNKFIATFKDHDRTLQMMPGTHGQWLLNKDLDLKHRYCGMANHPGDEWLVTSDDKNHQVDVYNTMLEENTVSPHFSSEYHHNLYRLCSLAFSKSGNTLFTLGARGALSSDAKQSPAARGSSMPVWLTAWAFNATSGKTESIRCASQVGRTSENSYFSSVHGLAVTTSEGVETIFASHSHSNTQPFGRFSFNEKTGNLTEEYLIKPGFAAKYLDSTNDGRFLAITPFFLKNPVEIHRCTSNSCTLFQTINGTQPANHFDPTDARYAHKSDLLAVAAEGTDGLVTFKYQTDASQWQRHQSLLQGDGFPLMKQPSLLTFSVKDDWLLVAAGSTVLIFEKSRFHRLRKTFFTVEKEYQTLPALWKNYLNKVCLADSRVKNKDQCNL